MAINPKVASHNSVTEDEYGLSENVGFSSFAVHRRGLCLLSSRLRHRRRTPEQGWSLVLEALDRDCRQREAERRRVEHRRYAV